MPDKTGSKTEKDLTAEEIIRELKIKLKLGENITGLLVNSRGSIKSQKFFDKVLQQTGKN
jgi:hypothetical protein